MDLDGLFHLSELVVIINIGYMGLDRVQRDTDRFWEHMTLAKTGATNILSVRFGVTKLDHPQELSQYLRNHGIYLLCFIAEIEIVLGRAARFARFFYTLSYVPLLGYFRNRKDKRVVSIVSALSVIIFLWICAYTLWPDTSIIDWLANIAVKRSLFFVMLAILMFLFISVICSYSLSHDRLDKICKKMAAKTEDVVSAQISSMEFLLKQAQERAAKSQKKPADLSAASMGQQANPITKQTNA